MSSKHFATEMIQNIRNTQLTSSARIWNISNLFLEPNQTATTKPRRCKNIFSEQKSCSKSRTLKLYLVPLSTLNGKACKTFKLRRSLALDAHWKFTFRRASTCRQTHRKLHFVCQSLPSPFPFTFCAFSSFSILERPISIFFFLFQLLFSKNFGGLTTMSDAPEISKQVKLVSFLTDPSIYKDTLCF